MVTAIYFIIGLLLGIVVENFINLMFYHLRNRSREYFISNVSPPEEETEIQSFSIASQNDKTIVHFLPIKHELVRPLIRILEVHQSEQNDPDLVAFVQALIALDLGRNPRAD